MCPLYLGSMLILFIYLFIYLFICLFVCLFLLSESVQGPLREDPPFPTVLFFPGPSSH